MAHARDLSQQKKSRKYPFSHMRINNHKILDSIQGRFECPNCNRSRKFFCYTCYIPVGGLENILPKLQLPLQIDIIKHKKEIDGKSTAAHAAVLASEHVKVHLYPNIPDYRNEPDVVLIYPSAESKTVRQFFNKNLNLIKYQKLELPQGYNEGTLLRKRMQEVIDESEENHKNYTKYNLPIKRAVFIDSTWNQSRSIYQDERVKGLCPVVLQNRASQFWRHQKGSPRWYLATVEAIHQFLLEVHTNAWGLNEHYRGLDNLEMTPEFFQNVRLENAAAADDIALESPYNGQYDNLMYFFANMYDLIHRYYEHNELKSYRRPI